MVEISNSTELEAWLKDKPLEWSQVLAARISLRVLPLIIVGFEKGNPFSEGQLKLILTSFRATFISWAARKYPAHDMVSAASFSAAALSGSVFAASAAFAADSIDSAFSAAALSGSVFAASAASSAAFAADSIDSAFSAAAAVSAASSATDSAAFSASISADPAAIWVLINADCELLLGYNSPNSAALNLVTENLWVAGPEITSSPKWFSEALTSLIQAIHENDDNWHVWIDWYLPVLRGQPCWGLRPENAERLIVQITKKDKTFWVQDVSAINAQIAEWLADFKEEEEAAQRSDIKQEISNLRQAIADTKPVHGGIGHNDPPEGFELSLEQTNQVEKAVDAIDTEMDKAEPSADALARSASVLKAVQLWVAKKADLAVDVFIIQIVTVEALAVAGKLLPIEWQKVYAGIGSVLEKILQWLSIGTPPI